MHNDCGVRKTRKCHAMTLTGFFFFYRFPLHEVFWCCSPLCSRLEMKAKPEKIIKHKNAISNRFAGVNISFLLSALCLHAIGCLFTRCLITKLELSPGELLWPLPPARTPRASDKNIIIRKHKASFCCKNKYRSLMSAEREWCRGGESSKFFQVFTLL